MITFQYISLHFLLLVVLIFFCRKISDARDDSKYWFYARFPIIAFTLEEGLRWGRETDWSLYYNVYQVFLRGDWTNHEPLFQVIWKIFAWCHCSYPVVISFSSFLFIFSVFVFFKPYRNVVWVAIPLCVGNHLIAASNTIRWYMAISMILIALTIIKQKKMYLGVGLLLASFLIHYGIIVLIPIFFLASRVKCVAKPKWAILTCVLLIFLFDDSVLSNFSFLFNLFKNVERFSGYFNYGMEGLFNHAQEQKTIFATLFTFIPYFAFILYGYHLKRDNKISCFLYNMIVLASYIKLVSVNLELFVRYYNAVDFFVCLVAGYVFIYLRNNCYRTQHVIFILFIVFYILRKFLYMMHPYDYEEYMMYVWNNNLMDPNAITAFRSRLGR